MTNGVAAGLALRAHARPAFAVVRTLTSDNANPPVMRIAYAGVTLPRAIIAEMPKRRPTAPQSTFAEPNRGCAVLPETNFAPWLSAPLQGRIAAIRNEHDITGPDGKPIKFTTTGIAGLGHQLMLPAQAGPKITDPSGAGMAAAGDGIVWFTEQRIPVYQPLALKDFRPAPIPWLTTAPPRVRLPTNGEVGAALANAGVAQQPKVAAAGYQSPEARSFLPPEASAAAASERAGVLTARRAMLLGTLQVDQGRDAFDPEHSRFGRPGQAGSSVPRQICTPRPGPLPPNSGDFKRDRRPCASPLLLSPLRASSSVQRTLFAARARARALPGPRSSLGHP